MLPAPTEVTIAPDPLADHGDPSIQDELVQKLELMTAWKKQVSIHCGVIESGRKPFKRHTRAVAKLEDSVLDFSDNTHEPVERRRGPEFTSIVPAN
jgi:hypothetical protein